MLFWIPGRCRYLAILVLADAILRYCFLLRAASSHRSAPVVVVVALWGWASSRLSATFTSLAMGCFWTDYGRWSSVRFQVWSARELAWT